MHIMVMVSDSLLLFMTVAIIILAYTMQNPLLWLMVIFLLYQCWIVWKEQGGIMAWTRKGRKEFEDGFDKVKRGK